MFDVDDEGLLSTISREYERVVNRCGVIDLSWKGKIEVKGPDADALMEYAIASPVGPVPDGANLVLDPRLG